MSLMPYDENSSDLNIKFSNCYGKTDKAVVKLNYFETDDEDNIFLDVDQIVDTATGIFGGSTNISMSEFEDEIDMSFPRLGVIEAGRGVLYTRRNLYMESPNKYRRGMTMFSVHYSDPNMVERGRIDNISLADTSRIELHRKVSTSLFFPKDRGIDDALELILSGQRYGAVISSQFYITFSILTDKIHLWRGLHIIGSYNYSTEVFEMTSDLFNTEIVSLNIATA